MDGETCGPTSFAKQTTWALRSGIILAGTFLIALSAQAQYRCAENGRTIFTDIPCSGSVKAQPSVENPGMSTGDGAYNTTSGAWRGQAQFLATAGGRGVPDAHAVVPMVIDIDPQGKVRGSSPENACKIMGIASPGMMATLANLDLTFSGCRYPGFNRRMFGTLALSPANKFAQLYLSGNTGPFSGPAIAFYEIKGTMRR